MIKQTNKQDKELQNKINKDISGYLIDKIEKKTRTNLIIPGDSLDQRLEKDQKTKIEEEKIKQRQKQTESYTGHGTAIKLYRDNTNNCVLWAKIMTGINRPLGSGGRNSVQGHEPRIGSIGVEKGVAHAVLIVDIQGDKIIINESNYEKNWITQRTLTKNDFIGYIYN